MGKALIIWKQMLLSSSSRKCVEISLENLCLDIGTLIKGQFGLGECKIQNESLILPGQNYIQIKRFLTYINCRLIISQFPLSPSPNRESTLRLKNFNVNLILPCNICIPTWSIILFFLGGGADIIFCLLRNFVFFWFHFDSVL